MIASINPLLESDEFIYGVKKGKKQYKVETTCLKTESGRVLGTLELAEIRKMDFVSPYPKASKALGMPMGKQTVEWICFYLSDTVISDPSWKDIHGFSAALEARLKTEYLPGVEFEINQPTLEGFFKPLYERFNPNGGQSQ